MMSMESLESRLLWTSASAYRLCMAAGSCRARICTSAGFCGTVMRNVQFVPDIPAFLKGQASTKDLKLQIETVSAEEVAAINA